MQCSSVQPSMEFAKAEEHSRGQGTWDEWGKSSLEHGDMGHTPGQPRSCRPELSEDVRKTREHSGTWDRDGERAEETRVGWRWGETLLEGGNGLQAGTRFAPGGGWGGAGPGAGVEGISAQLEQTVLKEQPQLEPTSREGGFPGWKGDPAVRREPV